MNTFAGLNTVQNKLNSSAAPDVTIAVGTIEYCEHVNSGYQCWYKSGANANQPVTFLGSNKPKSDSIPWSQNSNNGGNTPHCATAFTPNSQLLHDNVYNLWILEKRIQATGAGHVYMCLAISNVEDLAQSSPAFAWFGFEFDLDTVIPTNAQGHFYYPDYPQSGLWQTSTSTSAPYVAAKDQALWITYDLQDVDNHSNINGVLVCAVDLAGLRASTASPWVNNSKTPACAVAHPLTTFITRRSWVPANNSDTTPPIAADGEMFTYMIEPPKDGKSYLTDPAHTQGVEQWTIDWTAATPAPAFVNGWDLPSTQAGGDQVGCFNPASYYNTVCVPQPSTATTGVHIDSVADRMQQFFHYTSNSGQGSIWTSAHAIQIIPSATHTSQTEADIRILQRNAAIPNAVYVAGDYPIVDPVDPNAYVFLPSVVRDKVGNLQGILGISGSGANEHPGLDSLNFISSSLTAGTYGYIASPSTSGDAAGTDTVNYRWGDWYSAVLDPSDSCTVWVAGEYLAANRTTTPNWYTQIAALPPMSTCTGSGVSLSSLKLNFGNQQVGVKSAAMVETVTNNQDVSLNISGVSTGGSDYSETDTCPAAIPAGGSCAISVFFTPSISGTRNGTLTITDDAGSSPQTASLNGVGISSAISFSASSLAFGNQALNTSSAAQPVTVTNSGFVNLTVNSVAASGGYSESDSCTGVTLAPAQTCTVNAAFAPTVAASLPGAITVFDTSSGAPHMVTLSGTGVVAVTLSSTLTFPATNVGTASAAQTMTLTNNQTQTLTFTSATSGDYTAVGSGTAPCNGTLAGGAKCTYSVTFTPTMSGLVKGALTITHNAAGSPTAGTLSGTGQNGPAAVLSFNPTSLSFGNIALNTSSTKAVTVKNAGATAVTLSSFTGSGNYTVVSGGATPCGATLGAGKQCTVNVTFTPLVTGTFVVGMTLINSSAANPFILNATGNGVLAATLSPGTIAFGTVAVGSASALQVVTVTNNQTTALPINSVVASGDFTSTTGGSSPCGASVPASATCTLGVQFSPSVTGAISGALTFSYGAVSSQQVVGLSGTGQ